MIESRRAAFYKDIQRRVAVEAESKAARQKPSESLDTIKANGHLALETIRQIPPNTTIVNDNPEPTDPEQRKNYVGNITFLNISESDGSIIVTSSGPKHLTRMSPINFLITTGIACFKTDTRLIEINQEILNQYLPKPEQTLPNPANSCL